MTGSYGGEWLVESVRRVVDEGSVLRLSGSRLWVLFLLFARGRRVELLLWRSLDGRAGGRPDRVSSGIRWADGGILFLAGGATRRRRDSDSRCLRAGELGPLLTA